MWSKKRLSLSKYWSILRKRKRIFLFTLLIVFSSVILYAQIQTPIYRAVCAIELIELKSVVGIIAPTLPPVPYSLINSTSKALASRLVIEKMAYELGLVSEKTPPRELENTILAIQRAIKVKNKPLTNIIQIGVEHEDANMAAQMANAIAKTYIKIDADRKSERARNIRISIQEQVEETKQKLTDAENSLEAFKESEEEQASGIALALENNIAILEKQRTEFLKTYTYKYPDVVKISQQIGDLSDELQSLPENEIKFAGLTREYEIKEKTCRLLQSRLEDARIAEEKEIQDIKIDRSAVAPENPIKPNKKLALIIGLIAGIVLGEFVALIAEAFKF